MKSIKKEIINQLITQIKLKEYNFEGKKKDRIYREDIERNGKVYSFYISRRREKLKITLKYIQSADAYNFKLKNVKFRYSWSMKVLRLNGFDEYSEIENLTIYEAKKHSNLFSNANIQCFNSIKWRGFYYPSLMWRDKKGTIFIQFIKRIPEHEIENFQIIKD
jgi:hypothetical protein